MSPPALRGDLPLCAPRRLQGATRPRAVGHHDARDFIAWLHAEAQRPW